MEKRNLNKDTIDEFKLGRRQYAALGGKKYGKYLNDGKNRPYILKNNEFRKTILKNLTPKNNGESKN